MLGRNTNPQPRLALRVERWPSSRRSHSRCGKEGRVLARASEFQCALCERLQFAALAASRLYHELLTDLEASHICHDEARAFRIRTELSGALLDRDADISDLAEHERTHVNSSTTASPIGSPQSEREAPKKSHFWKDSRLVTTNPLWEVVADNA
jgi:hypothetical protein